MDVLRGAQQDAAGEGIQQLLVLRRHALPEVLMVAELLADPLLRGGQHVHPHAAVGGALHRLGQELIREEE